MYTAICVYSPRVPQFFSCLFFLFLLRFLASWVTERLKTMWGRSTPGPPLWPRTGSIHSSPLSVSSRPAWGVDHTQSINQLAHTPSSSESLKMWYSFMSSLLYLWRTWYISGDICQFYIWIKMWNIPHSAQKTNTWQFCYLYAIWHTCLLTPTYLLHEADSLLRS
jgi:hypothetical protein